MYGLFCVQKLLVMVIKNNINLNLPVIYINDMKE